MPKIHLESKELVDATPATEQVARIEDVNAKGVPGMSLPGHGVHCPASNMDQILHLQLAAN
jgi:hypothetical protein